MDCFKTIIYKTDHVCDEVVFQLPQSARPQKCFVCQVSKYGTSTRPSPRLVPRRVPRWLRTPQSCAVCSKTGPCKLMSFCNRLLAWALLQKLQILVMEKAGLFHLFRNPL